MATTPVRFNGVIETIESVYNQADKIRIYLNNFTEIPNNPYLNDDKVLFHLGERDLRSSGKFYWALNKDEYYLPIDDDIIYPPTYGYDMRNFLETFEGKVYLTHHGKIMNSGKIQSYYYDIHYKFPFTESVLENRVVNIVGTGVSAFNTNDVTIDINGFKYLYMDDIEVSLQLRKQSVTPISLQHPEWYLKSNPQPGNDLYNLYKMDHSNQTERYNSIVWN